LRSKTPLVYIIVDCGRGQTSRPISCLFTFSAPKHVEPICYGAAIQQVYMCVCMYMYEYIFSLAFTHTLIQSSFVFPGQKRKDRHKMFHHRRPFMDKLANFLVFASTFRLNVAPSKPSRLGLGCSMMTSESLFQNPATRTCFFFIITFCFRRNRPESVPGPLFMEPKHFGQFL